MAKVTFSSRWGRVKTQKKMIPTGNDTKSVQDFVRDIKKDQRAPAGEDYREKSLAIHGLVCARCGREFNESKRHLLTVHHKDSNHQNNPADGSNWENLCVYCHEDIHSRGVLADYLGSETATREFSIVYEDVTTGSSTGLMAQKLKKALQKNK